jgi:hypothetical protein
MRSPYEHFDRAFERVSASAIIAEGRCVGRIAWKLPTDGAARLYCYFQLWGGPMTRGSAGGFGYDKRGAALYDAIAKWLQLENSADPDVGRFHSIVAEAQFEGHGQWSSIRAAFEARGVTIQHIID